jgi:hypothetical protein
MDGAANGACGLLHCGVADHSTKEGGFNPRPAQVSLGFSGLQYLAATVPRAPGGGERAIAKLPILRTFWRLRKLWRLFLEAAELAAGQEVTARRR